MCFKWQDRVKRKLRESEVKKENKVRVWVIDGQVCEEVGVFK